MICDVPQAAQNGHAWISISHDHLSQISRSIHAIDCFNSLTLGRCGINFKNKTFKLIIQNHSLGTSKKLLSGEYQSLTKDMSTLVRVMLYVVRHQAITQANVDPEMCRHMTSLGHNILSYIGFHRPCSAKLMACIVYDIHKIHKIKSHFSMYVEDDLCGISKGRFESARKIYYQYLVRY